MTIAFEKSDPDFSEKVCETGLKVFESLIKEAIANFKDDDYRNGLLGIMQYLVIRGLSSASLGISEKEKFLEAFFEMLKKQFVAKALEAESEFNEYCAEKKSEESVH